MKTESSNRESQRVTELATDYRNKGFKVVTPHSTSESPVFLRNSRYIPDLIALSEKENLIVEVKSKQSSRDLDRLSEIAELVNSQPNWQFVLVFTNPRESSASISQPSAEKVGLLLDKSHAIGTGDQIHVEAAFLFAWMALEAALRLLPQERKSAKMPSTPWTLIRNATMEGHIGRDDAKALDRLFKIRNSLLHAGSESLPSVGDVEKLRRIAEEIIHTNSANEV